MLQAQVDAAPPGSRIDWATYYFRDRALAEALMRASDRGVRVTLVIEAQPRRRSANEPVARMLGAHGLRGGFQMRAGGLLPGSLHAKIYAFSKPCIAWVGSFNPSGDEPEDAEVIAEIGDQDRGHNLLVGVTDAALVEALVRRVGMLGRQRSLLDRFRAEADRAVESGDTRLFFYPRLRTRLVEREIDLLGRGDAVRGAVSHLKRGSLTRAIVGASRRGASVRLLVHDTERRVPGALVDELRRSGVEVERIVDPQGLPMHAKFLLTERGGASAAWLGSFNYNPRSRWLNDELLMRSEAPELIAALELRFEEIAGAR